MKKINLSINADQSNLFGDEGLSEKDQPSQMELLTKLDFIPLSFSQERLWFIDRLEGSTHYHLPMAFHLKGYINTSALSFAFEMLVNRHSILRTVIQEVDDSAWQNILPENGQRVIFIDGSVKKGNAAWLQNKIEQLIAEPFDLSKDRLLRVGLITLAQQEHVLVLAVHHIAADYFSLNIILNELSALYSAFVEDRLPQVISLSLQYADYATWQRSYFNNEVVDKQLAYWKGKLQETSVLQLPADFARPKSQDTHGASVSFLIEELLLEQAKDYSRHQNVTLFMLLLASFKALLYRYTGQEDICVGTKVPARQNGNLLPLVGFFENTLALRTKVAGNDLITDLLQQVKLTVDGALENENLPFEKVVDAVVREREMNRNPLFDVLFLLRSKDEISALRFPSVTLTDHNIQSKIALFDITFILAEATSGLTGEVVYATAIYKKETIELMVAHFRQLLFSITSGIKQKTGALPMLDANEKEHLLFNFNNTRSSFPAKSINALFEEQVVKSPDSIALAFNNRQLTYRELNDRSNQLAHYLKNKGLPKEALVPLFIERGLDMIAGLMGILKAGGAFVPLDPEYPLDRIRYMLEDSQAKIVISSKQSRLKLAGIPGLDIIEIDDIGDLVSLPKENLAEIINPAQLAYVIYTSGSTGNPKGVMVQHNSVVNLLASIVKNVAFKAQSSFLSVTTFSFDICYLEFFVPLISGGKLIIISRETAMDGYRLAESIANYKPTHIQGTPSSWQLLLDSGWENKEGLKILIGGEAITETIKDQLTKLGDVFNLYGPTETTIWSAIKKLAVLEKVSIGKPLDNTVIYILNEQLELCLPNVAGEIFIGGAGVARGYWERPSLTNEKFIADPFKIKDGGRLYKTGDLGKWLPDGNIEYLSRIDNQVKIRGYRIELGEIETCLQQDEMIRQAVVIAKENKEGVKRLVCYYIPEWQALKLREKKLYLKQVASWQEVYDTEYAETADAITDEEFDYNIWKDSFTGVVFEEQAMREWLQHTIDIVLQEKPVNVLEIGSGKGLIFYRLAGKIKKYIGTDFSASCIQSIKNQIKNGSRDYCEADLYVCAAHEVVVDKEEDVDTILINSVAQHFPGEDYMNEVIAKSIKILNGHGRIIIGDVRSNQLLEAFKLQLNLQKLPLSLTVNEFLWTAGQEVIKEEELLFSPEYFYNFLSVHPGITHIDIQLKRGFYFNELSRYRYDVIIYVGINKETYEPEWQPMETPGQTKHAIEQVQNRERIIAFKNVPNPRLTREKLLSGALKNNIAGTVGELQKICAKGDRDALNVKEILKLASEAGYHISLYPAKDIHEMNVLLELVASDKFVKQLYLENAELNNALFTNIPLFTDIAVLMQKDIRELLQRSLPEFMVPSEFMAIARLPLTNNGKTDRKFLSRREDKVTLSADKYEAPHSHIEQVLAATWQELLGVERIGLRDNFFEMGGHSLLATRTVSAVRKKLHVELFIKDLFIHPTIAALAKHIAAQNNTVVLSGIGVQQRPDNIPLSFSQERLWFIDRLEGSVHYHVPNVFRLKGKLNKEALNYAFKSLVNRHEVLRTVFPDIEGVAFQYILLKDGWSFNYIEGSLYKKDPKELISIIRKLIDDPFDLSKDHPLRANLIALDESTNILVVVTHHIASDGWSESVIVKEILHLYNSFEEKGLLQLPPLSIQYPDFAIWQRNSLQGEYFDKKINYWKLKLEGVAGLQLPTDYVRPALQSRHGAITKFRIDKKLTTALQLLSQQQGVTLFMVLLATFKVLLHRYSGQRDICVGTPIAGRQQHELEGLIGFFVNTLALRTVVDNQDSFAGFLQKVKNTTMEAYDHQEVPFEKVVEAVVKDRDMSRNPLFQVMFVLLNTPEVLPHGFKGLKISQLPATSFQKISKFEFTLFLTETTNGLKCEVEYCTDVYKEQTIKRMMAHFIELLNSVVINPMQSVAMLPMLSKVEHYQLSVAFANSATTFPITQTIVDFFEAQAEKLPDNIAVAFEEEALSYKQLNERSDQLAYYLKNTGVQTGTMVPVCMERSIGTLVAILGILKAGAAYVPIDSKYPTERIRFMFDDVAARLVISSKESRGVVVMADHNINILEIDGDWPQVDKEPVNNLETAISCDDLAYVIYTSGSTGKPKGVMVTHGNVVSLVKGVDFLSLSDKDILLSTGSFSFDATTLEYWGMLLNGGQLVLCKESCLLDQQLLKKEITGKRINRMWFTSSWFNQLIEADITLFETLQTVIVGGEKLSERHIEKLRQTYPAIEIINGYGPTENTTFSSTYLIKEKAISKPVPIGRPLNNRSIFILDGHQQLVPVGVSGELYLAGAGLAKGYLNQPGLTAEKFIANPFNTAAGEGAMMYKSGDLGRWLPDGNIEFLGRLDEQVKIRGFRIELGEVENVLHQCDLIVQSLVLAKEDSFGNKYLVGYVKPAHQFNKEAIVSYLRAKLPEYMVPTIWVEVEQFPLTPNGKIDFEALPKATVIQPYTNQYEAPRNSAETAMAGIWQHLLGLETISIHENFFDAGGHSLNAMRLVSLIKNRMGMEVSISDIFIYPTIAGLLKNFDEKSKNPLIASLNIKYLVPIKTGSSKLPLYIMAGGGGTALKFKKFSELLSYDQPVHVLQPPINSKELKEFPDDIEGIAAKFIEEIVIQNPQGPYALSGHCLGGIIAFEMARQLQAQGKKVQLLMMFDAILNQDDENVPATLQNLYQLPGILRKSVAKILLKFDFEMYLLKHHPRQSLLYKINSLKSLIYKISGGKKNAREPHHTGLEIFNEASEIYSKACKKYKLVPYNGKIILFYAKEHYFFLDTLKNVEFKKLYLDERTKNMWNQYADNIEVHDVEGEHSEIFDPVHGDAFAHLLQGYLNSGHR